MVMPRAKLTGVDIFALRAYLAERMSCGTDAATNASPPIARALMPMRSLSPCVSFSWICDFHAT